MRNEIESMNVVFKGCRNDKTEYRKNIPSIKDLETQLSEASVLIDDIILKKYLYRLSDFEIVPLEDELKSIGDIRIFKIDEMIYQKDEHSTYKLASVFNSVQHLNCGVFVIIVGDGEKTSFYMGVRSLDDKRTTKSLKDSLKNSLIGHFPGVKTTDLLDSEAEIFLKNIPCRNLTAVSCVANIKENRLEKDENYIQGLEKFAVAMQGQKYTAVILAKSTLPEQLEEVRRAYETIYTQISPFANMQLSYGRNVALSVSDAVSRGMTTGSSYSETKGFSEGKSYSKSETISNSESLSKSSIWKSLGNVVLSGAAFITAPLTGGASLAAACAISMGNMALSLSPQSTKTTSRGNSISNNISENTSRSESKNYGINKSISETDTHTVGSSEGTSENIQLTMKNKNLIDTLEKIELQIKRLNECDSFGMWECSSYFFSDSQETAEMAAGTYKALMKGIKSGVETSAINYWGPRDINKVKFLREYVTNFLHPVFLYNNGSHSVPVTAASLVSGNELAIHMSLPRHSVCGFPVIKHADFPKEVISYDCEKKIRPLRLGNIFSMGSTTKTPIDLDVDSFSMHTFVTGSTGSGKSNTIYEMLNQIHSVYGIPFLVVEPAKGEYKNVFGHFSDVVVYGTNPSKNNLLVINPFSFPKDIHILEHLDRLIEIFNVCWPMYAAMPAILKDSIERAYVSVGWNLVTSENENDTRFPCFRDVLKQLGNVIEESNYSNESKGDYLGALSTRVHSLTTGLNGIIFNDNEIPYGDLFDKCSIVDLSRVGSNETKSLIMGLLVMKLSEYRMSSGRSNSLLTHITVIEEAHNLLKSTSSTQSFEGSNLLGKSVELIANAISEMRTYGEGFVIVDQSPGLLDKSVIRNTNTKIILRLPDREDRNLVGYAAGLNDEQIIELAKLRKGVAAVYQNDWIAPVLVQINKCSLKEEKFNYYPTKVVNVKEIREQVVNLLTQGRVREKLNFSIDDIENGIYFLDISSDDVDILSKQIIEYKKNNVLEIWKDDKFPLLSRLLVDILKVREKVESCVYTAKDNEELTNELKELIITLFPMASKQKIIVLAQCFMRDMSLQNNANEYRLKVYELWAQYVRRNIDVLCD